MTMKQVIMATDGSCMRNPGGPGGWAALLRCGKHEKLISGCEASTTNNRMELMAVIEGFKALNETCTVTVQSDSLYVINAFAKRWIKAWRANGWVTKAKEPVKNRELWEALEAAQARHHVTWEWVRGHNGHADNEAVDAAARKETEKAARMLSAPRREPDATA